MANTIIIIFTLIAALGIYFSPRGSAAFLLPAAGVFVISIRTEAVPLTHAAVISSAGLIFLVLGKIFQRRKKLMSALGVIAVWALTLLRIC
ncbi:MAG: hypothetical protein CVU78_05085 [Elusimicrobia bacterium HGW-Elusimicrobia-2]|nr:MAG: hypothetical protein CVU78_05085 [Elusimicrobia bacterium HGW-Elusimicrobia-2]